MLAKLEWGTSYQYLKLFTLPATETDYPTSYPFYSGQVYCIHNSLPNAAVYHKIVSPDHPKHPNLVLQNGTLQLVTELRTVVTGVLIRTPSIVCWELPFGADPIHDPAARHRDRRSGVV